MDFSEPSLQITPGGQSPPNGTGGIHEAAGRVATAPFANTRGGCPPADHVFVVAGARCLDEGHRYHRFMATLYTGALLLVPCQCATKRSIVSQVTVA